MKKAGLIILVIGLIILLFTGFNYVTKEKVVEIGNLEITADKTHHVAWSPLAGAAVMVVGGVIFLIGRKE
ncbi:MAG: hypothetical protein ACFCU6_10070 [Balneolaceae bacterium]